MNSRIEPERVRRGFLLVLVLGISLLFLLMIRRFLMPVFLAAIATGLMRPLYRRITEWLRGRESLAAIATLILVLVVIVAPLMFFAGIVTSQAVQITERVGPFIQEELARPHALEALVERFPRLAVLLPYQSILVSRLGDLAGSTGGFLFNSLAAATRGTVSFIFALFVMLYSMFFFLRDGPRILDRILYLMPLSPSSEERMVERFGSVTRATIKGTLIIGIVQGALAGGALALAGIHGVAFWSTVMVVLSIIPGIGTALVWFPAVVYLAVTGKMGAAIAVFLWCAIVVGTADNFLRPMLVGRDTEMSDLLILLSTLGGLVMFGAAGIVVGPIVAALFVTVWDLYATAFGAYLPSTTPATEAG
jgi:predicted PurR-regulated permease PerM